MPACGVLHVSSDKRFTVDDKLFTFTHFFVPRWDMSVDKKVYTDISKKARTLQRMKELSSHSYSTCSRHLGCVLPPLLNISLDNVVLDELHLLLRIMDVLIRNLILYADGEDTNRGQRSSSRMLVSLEAEPIPKFDTYEVLCT